MEISKRCMTCSLRFPIRRSGFSLLGKGFLEEIHADAREVEVHWNRKGKQTPPKNEVTRMRLDAWRTGANEVPELTKVNQETRKIAREMVTMESIENETDGDGP